MSWSAVSAQTPVELIRRGLPGWLAYYYDFHRERDEDGEIALMPPSARSDLKWTMNDEFDPFFVKAMFKDLGRVRCSKVQFNGYGKWTWCDYEVGTSDMSKSDLIAAIKYELRGGLVDYSKPDPKEERKGMPLLDPYTVQGTFWTEHGQFRCPISAFVEGAGEPLMAPGGAGEYLRVGFHEPDYPRSSHCTKLKSSP